MDYAHHDAIYSHRVYSLQAVERRLNHHVTMRVNQVMMCVIHTSRSPERSEGEGEAKDQRSEASTSLTKSSSKNSESAHSQGYRKSALEVPPPRSQIYP